MYFTLNKHRGVLNVSDSFAYLKTIHEDGSLEFEVRYTASQASIVKLGSMTVEVSVLSRNVKKQKKDHHDASITLDDILLDSSLTKSIAKNADNYVLCTTISDISSMINNEIVGSLSRGVASNRLQATYHTKLRSIPVGQLTDSNDVKPILSVPNLRTENVFTLVSSSLDDDVRNLCHKLITEQGIDPSMLVNVTGKFIESKDSFDGTRERQGYHHNDLDRLYNHVTLDANTTSIARTNLDVDNHKMIDVIVTESNDILEIPVNLTFKMPKAHYDSRDASSNVFVRFRLLESSTKVVLDEVIKVIDVAKFVRSYRLPTIPPIVKQVTSEIATRANLQITQRDQIANEVVVYKKTISNLTIPSEYTFVGSYSVSYNQSAIVQIDVPRNSAVIYRVISSHDGALCPTYAAIVVKPTKAKIASTISLTSNVMISGITIEARKIPVDVVALQFLQRNLSTHQSEFEEIQDPIVIDDSMRLSDCVTINSMNVQDNNVYEFIVKAFYRNGSHDYLGNEITEYVSQSSGKVDIRIDNLIISYDLTVPNVTFDVNIASIDSNIDVVKSLLEQRGIKNYFDEDISKQRDELKALLAYSVQRIDLTTGEREDFGVMSESKFDDINVGKKYACTLLKRGHKYRYVISALARMPETLFDKFQKTVVDAETKKTYTYNPAKFMHPLALRQGTIVSQIGLKTIYSKSMFEHGIIGTTSTFDVTFDDDVPKIIDASVVKFDDQTMTLSWKVDGNMELIDSFIVMKEVVGLRKVVACVHNLFETGNCQFVYHVTRRDVGEFRFVIVPIMHDYRLAPYAITNYLRIEE